MGTEAIKAIILRAMNEPEFRQLLLTVPNEALRGYDLSPDEHEALSSLSHESLDEMSGGLEERISRSLIGRKPTLWTCPPGCGN